MLSGQNTLPFLLSLHNSNIILAQKWLQEFKSCGLCQSNILLEVMHFCSLHIMRVDVITPLNIFKPPLGLWDILMNVKDPVPVTSRSDLVYWIPCSECTNSYIGQTKSLTCHRIKEHQYSLFVGNKNASALTEHLTDRGHKINWDMAEILTIVQE